MAFPCGARVMAHLRALAFSLPFALLAIGAHAQHDGHAQSGDQSRSQATQSGDQSRSQAQSGSQWGGGKNLYEKVCGYCHDPEVGVGTVLAGRELPAVYLNGIVRSGLNAMPAFPASFIDDESIDMLAEYLATLPAPDSESTTAESTTAPVAAEPPAAP